MRVERGLSVREAARRAGLVKETISSIERGQSHPHDLTLAKLAKAYSVPVEELLEDEPVVPSVTLPHMTREQDAAARRKALEAAEPEQVAQHLHDVGRAVLTAGQQLSSPEHQLPGEQEGLTRYMQALLDLQREAEPYAVPVAEEQDHASVAQGVVVG
jgi:transcriptional regulator with XRE-family HTH domain